MESINIIHMESINIKVINLFYEWFHGVWKVVTFSI